MGATAEERWRRLLAVGRVRWMPGMRFVVSGERPESRTMGHLHDALVASGGAFVTAVSIEPCGMVEISFAWAWDSGDGCGPEQIGAVPDFEHPATLGCLLAMTREHAGMSDVFVASEGPGRFIATDLMALGLGLSHGSGATAAEALLDAIERAPVPG